MKTILVAGGVSLLLALFGTPLAIKIFSRRGYGQAIREEGPAGHATKRGTPTMGGTVIVIAALAGYFLGNVATGQVPSISGLLVMMLMTGLGVVGFVDDEDRATALLGQFGQGDLEPLAQAARMERGADVEGGEQVGE